MYLIEVSITKGTKQALYVDLGIFFSDLSCIVLSYIFLDQLEFLTHEEALMGIIAGSIFILFGLAYLLKSGKSVDTGAIDSRMIDAGKKVKKVKGKSESVSILKGFFLNMMNPSVLIYWLSVMVIAAADFDGDGQDIFIFFTALLITFFSIDVMKIFGAAYLRKFLKQSIIERINIFTGVAFLIGGVIFLVKGILTL